MLDRDLRACDSYQEENKRRIDKCWNRGGYAHERRKWWF